jgi:hypothetical protein
VGKRYVVRLRAENAIHWRIAKGKAPRGLRLNSAGVLSGRAKKAGRFRMTITATGSAGQTTVGVFSIRVVPVKR